MDRPFLYVLPKTSRVVLHKGADNGDAGDKAAEVVLKQAFSPGTLVEFCEKKREHIGKITQVAHKSNGGARYEVEEVSTGKQFSIADKEVSFGLPAPNNEKQTEKLLAELEKAHAMHQAELVKVLDITPDLLEMAWEEALESEDNKDSITAKALVELVHAHSPNPIEKYEAWRLLRSDLGHVYFKELKENSRVVAFKAKSRSSVEASKDTFVKQHESDDWSDTTKMMP